MPGTYEGENTFHEEIAITADGDPASAAIFNQPHKDLADRTVFLKLLFEAFASSATFGADLVDTEAEAITPRITIDAAESAVADYTLIGSFESAKLWIGAGATSPLVITVNATRVADGNDKWEKITTGQPALALYLRRDRTVFCSMPAAQDTAWSDAFVAGEGTTSGWGRLLDLAADNKNETLAQSDVARWFHQVSTTSGCERVLICEFKNNSFGSARLYFAQDLEDDEDIGFEITANCWWDNTNNIWTRDQAGFSAKWVFSKQTFSIFTHHTTDGTTWNDTSGWASTVLRAVFSSTESDVQNEFLLDNGGIKFRNLQEAAGDDGNPPSNNAQTNRLCAKNIPKAWVDFTTDSQTIHDGFNVASAGFSGTVAVVNWHQNFDSDDYVVEVQVQANTTTTAHLTHVTTKAAGTCSIAVFSLTVGADADCALIDAGANPIRLLVTAYGKQTS